MSVPRYHRLAACLAVVYLASQVQAQLTQDDWVTNARAADPPQFDQKHVVYIGDDCLATIKEGDLSATKDSGSTVSIIELIAGVGVILDVCAGDTKAQVFKAPELFKASALWKVESVSGYIEGVQLIESNPTAGRCQSIYFIPVVAGNYTAEIETCTSLTVAVNVKTDSTISNPGLQTVDLVEEPHSTTNALDVEITLMYSPECGVSSTPSTEGLDGVMEGGGESAGTPPVESGSEGADGVYEGTGEGNGYPPPYVENGSESNEGAPSPDEGADGVYEGTGESSTDEGADGVYEGTGEGNGLPPPPFVENGSESGESTATAPPPFVESGGESGESTTGRRLSQENDAAPTTTAKWFWTKGHSPNQNSLIDPAAVDPVEGSAVEGEGAVEAEGGRRLLSWSRTLSQTSANKPVYDATITPIELVVGRMYRISVNLVRASQASYFSAADFFMKSIVSHVEDAGGVVEMMQLREIEIYPGSTYMVIYVQPKTEGTYTFSSTDDVLGGATGTFKVIADETMLSNATAFPTTQVSLNPCSAADGSSVTTGGTPPVSMGMRGAVVSLCTLAVGAAFALLL